MAKNNNKSTKKPMSLNDSHYRFLQEHSAPPKPTFDQESIKSSPRKQQQQQQHVNIPQFSAITDFDSPFGLSSGEKQQQAPSHDIPQFSLNSTTRPNLDKKHEPINFHDDDDEEEEAPPNDIPQFSINSNPRQNSDVKRDPIKFHDDEEEEAPPDVVNSPPKEEKKTKVKVQGQRRLCKVVHEDAGKSVAVGESKFDELIDLDSPIPAPRKVIQIEESGGKNEITDILNEINSKFELLSVERKLKPKHVEVLVGGKQNSDDDGSEFGSAGSSFSSQQESLSEGTKNGDGDDIEYDADDSVQELDHFEPETDASITFTGPRSTYKLQAKIAKMLYPHQREGLKWLWSLHCLGKGGILGDDMGLGKTMQMCGFLAGLFHSRLIRRALIVAPKTLLPHWIKELSAVGLSEKTREYFGTSTKLREYELQYILQDNGVLLTTYDIVRNNSKSLQGNNYFDDEDNEEGPTWDYMILDEGHLIKNPSTQRAKSLLEIPSAHRIIISGTPLQNNLKELWALFNFCCPELLGDHKWFNERLEYPILRGNDKHASDREKRVGSSVAKELRDRIHPYFLRRLKSEVFNQDDDKTTAKLSQKQEIIVWLRLTSVQRHLYEAFLKSEIVLSAFDSPLAALTILKKICDHPLLLTKRAAEGVLEGMNSMLKPEEANVAEKLAIHLAVVAGTGKFKDEQDVSCKISFIMSLLDNLIPEGHCVLIFSQTRKMLNLIQECLVSEGYDFLRIDGTTKATDRLKIVNDFQEGFGAPIFLLTSQVGGLGLTLTRADRVIVVDPAWNPSTDNQCVDRAYRIGQKKDVLVYRLMTCGTVEEKIYRKQVYKGGLFKIATEHKEQIRYFSQQDLRKLFSLPKEGFDVSVTQRQLNEEHDRQHTVDDSFRAHIEFLKRHGIAGVSHHSLLFSKAAPVRADPEDDEATSTDNQSVDWAYRIGQKKDVLVYRLMTCGTVEEKTYRKQVYKGGLFKTAMNIKNKFGSLASSDDSFRAHTEFLKSHSIAGVSHHSLLFSKTAPVRADPEDDEVTRNQGAKYVGTSRSSSNDHTAYGPEFAFNPKDVRLSKKGSSPTSAGKLTESEIKDKIKSISQTLSNMASKLPDKGEKLQKRLAELNLELAELKREERNVVDLDDFTTEFQRVLNV